MVERDTTYNNPEDDLRAASAVSITAVDGSQVENVKAENIRIENVHTPIFLRLGRRNKRNDGPDSSMKNIHFNQVLISGVDQPTAIHGLPEQIIQQVVYWKI